MTDMTTEKRTWRSLREFENDAQLLEYARREFPTDDFDQLESGTDVDRRRFLQLLGASAALAGASSCRWEKEIIRPYATRPEDTIPGTRKQYATVMDLDGAARPLRVTTFDGRPIKVEPNELAGVGTDVFSQAAILGFYDPDRSREVIQRVDGEPTASTWEAAIDTLRTRAAAGKTAVLASTSSSPTLQRLAGKLSAAGTRLVWWSPSASDSVHAGARQAFGRDVRTRYDLAAADVVLSLDCDFQREHPDSLRMSGDFATRRRPEDGNMSRLYAVESRFTSTGVTADHRLPVRSADVGSVLELIEARLGGAAPGARAQALGGDARVEAFVAATAGDLTAAGAKACVVVGAGQPAAVHARVHGINSRLGAVGTTVHYCEEPLAVASTEALKELVAAMNAGQIDTLLVLEGNPVYDAPADLEFGAALAKVPATAHLSLYRDETSELCTWHLPANHWIESWGDARSWDGTLHLAQPLILPLHGGRSAIELVAALLGDDRGGQELVRESFETFGLAGDANARWLQALHDGTVEGTRFAPVAVSPGGNTSMPQPATGMEITFHHCPKVYDGRFANNGWLQELPDFVTKMTWDNALMVGVVTAKELGVKSGDMMRVELDGRTLEAVAYVAPGHAEESLSLALGYGREHAGHVAGFAQSDVASAGFNAYALRTSSAPSIATGAKVTKARGTYQLATTQEHHLIDAVGMEGRAERLPMLVREGTKEEWNEHPDFAQHRVHVPPLESLFKSRVYEGAHQWGMGIDLSVCNGCNACVISCQSENNIPIVGKEQVANGREMHWIRVDLYFQGDADDAKSMDAVNQPVNCLQCENAPCEQVCPVAATVHSEEGLNDMVYNRCIGTRYCGNNCPAKVRRFNYFHYTKHMDQPEQKLLQLAQNPEVTVRSRGVMEKCTYCTQRISLARIKARNEGRKIRDGEVVTACQSACPTQAITFGDLTDPESAVSKVHALPRTYKMLEELNIRPRTQYSARISNPNPVLAEAMPQGVAAPAGHGGHGDDHASEEHNGNGGH